MDLFTAIHTRRSIRSFTEEPVVGADVEKILGAAMAAPSAGNQQPWSFIVIRNKEKLAEVNAVHPHAKMLEGASVVLLVCGHVDVRWPTFWPQDCSAATQNILLAARGLGLGACWAGVYPEQDRMSGIRDIFAIPEDVMPFALIPIGHTETESKSQVRFKEERIFDEVYGTAKASF